MLCRLQICKQALPIGQSIREIGSVRVIPNRRPGIRQKIPALVKYRLVFTSKGFPHCFILYQILLHQRISALYTVPELSWHNDMSKEKIHHTAKKRKSKNRYNPRQFHRRIILPPDNIDYRTETEQPQHKGNPHIIISPP